jgi:hypothetical protein
MMSSQKNCDACGFSTPVGKDIDSRWRWGELTIFGEQDNSDPLYGFGYGRNNRRMDLCPRCVQQVESLLSVFEKSE